MNEEDLINALKKVLEKLPPSEWTVYPRQTSPLMIVKEYKLHHPKFPAVSVIVNDLYPRFRGSLINRQLTISNISGIPINASTTTDLGILFAPTIDAFNQAELGYKEKAKSDNIKGIINFLENIMV